jgi:hypothetical protein
MSMKWVRIAGNFSEKAQSAALITVLTLTVAWSGERLNCQPERPQGLAFVSPCWSVDLPPHTPGTAPNTMMVNVLSPSLW